MNTLFFAWNVTWRMYRKNTSPEKKNMFSQQVHWKILGLLKKWSPFFFEWGTLVHSSGGSTSIRCAAKKVSPLLCQPEIAKVGSEIGWLKPVGLLETATERFDDVNAVKFRMLEVICTVHGL